MGKMKSLYTEMIQEKVSILMDGLANVYASSQVEVDDILEGLAKNIGVKVAEDKQGFVLTRLYATKPAGAVDVVVKLDADHAGQLIVMLQQKRNLVLKMAETTEEPELLEDLQDLWRLRMRVEENRVTKQDLETFEVIEQELEEMYGCK